VTNEQIIILALFAAAFLAGWVTHALTAAASRRLRAPAPSNRNALVPVTLAAPTADRFEAAVDESRRELERAIRAYHTTVTLSLEDGGPASSPPTSLDVLVRALAALSIAVEHASRELEGDNALATKLHATGSELRLLAQEVLLHEADAELPPTIFDRLEQHLTTAAAVILAPGRLQPHTS
jgi:hypothetical protein